MRKIVIVAALAAIIAGCAGTKFSFDRARQVTVGMSEAEVITLMGNPYSVSTLGDKELWIWSYANGVSGGSRTISFLLNDGRVVETPNIPKSFK
jgi:hypothetical protein